MQQDRVDLVFTGPSEYVVMRARTNAVPIAAIKREKYYPVIAVLAQSGIKSIKDLKGKRIAMWENRHIMETDTRIGRNPRYI